MKQAAPGDGMQAGKRQTTMNPKELRIVFMGTPEFAVPSLRALVAGGYNVVGVVTTPDKPPAAGRNSTGAT